MLTYFFYTLVQNCSIFSVFAIGDTEVQYLQQAINIMVINTCSCVLCHLCGKASKNIS